MRQKAEGNRIAGGARWRFVSVANRARIAAKDLAEARARRAARFAGPTAAERQAELLGFYERFETFVESLCEAAQYGPTPRLEETFAREHAPLIERYEALRPYLGAFQDAEEPDAFDRLLEPTTLRAFLDADDGAMIMRINGAREALSHYAEHLRQLAARTAA